MATTLRETKDTLVDRAEQQMRAHFTDSKLTTRQKLALTCRALFDRGHDSGLAGQITARGQEPATYYTQRLGLGFDEITEDNLLLVDEDLTVLDGDGMPNPANRFHSWIYRAREDVNCIIHTHSPAHGRPRHAGSPLVVSQMDTTPCTTTAPSSRTGRASPWATRRARSSPPPSATSGPSCSPTTASW